MPEGRGNSIGRGKAVLMLAAAALMWSAGGFSYSIPVYTGLFKNTFHCS